MNHHRDTKTQRKAAYSNLLTRPFSVSLCLCGDCTGLTCIFPVGPAIVCSRFSIFWNRSVHSFFSLPRPNKGRLDCSMISISSFGNSRSKPRTIRLSKSSSAARRSMLCFRRAMADCALGAVRATCYLGKNTAPLTLKYFEKRSMWFTLNLRRPASRFEMADS